MGTTFGDLVPMGESYHCSTRSDYCLQLERRGVCIHIITFIYYSASSFMVNSVYG